VIFKATREMREISYPGMAIDLSEDFIIPVEARKSSMCKEMLTLFLYTQVCIK
jgi:hypothetical protein